ncbi:hypothetical protein LMG28614_00554 [Paraburkholderia ultramafica]|uniref:Uncharacterized protein n=1 Tax=Paraburkholderia ultramafica TaxID=1544867 RepID=A0A6S7AWN7_9BURK|nr:hypothetical protein [Paraburkholderia ultramafica]CAB3778155.1 hypothetical protein LMG28614_00554 [Paraburkholderia ultramafica]
MPVNFNSSPVTNTTPLRISFNDAHGNMVATLDSDEAKVLTITFTSIVLHNPPNPPVMRNQNPPAAITVHPGNVAFVEMGPGGAVVLNYAMPNQANNQIVF